MFNRTAENFVRKHGISGIERLRALANQNADIARIAETFNVSRSTACRLQAVLLKKVYYISDATTDWLRYCEQRHSWIAETHRQEISKAALPGDANLILISGGARNE